MNICISEENPVSLDELGSNVEGVNLTKPPGWQVSYMHGIDAGVVGSHLVNNRASVICRAIIDKDNL